MQTGGIESRASKPVVGFDKMARRVREAKQSI